MDKMSKIFRHSLFRGGLAAIVLGAVLLAFPMAAVAQFDDYRGSDTCGSSGCHNDKFQEWKASGHPYKLMRGEEARNRPIPLPSGLEWDDISWVIGGYKWKSRYMDVNGYIITQDETSEGGNTQYNYLTGEWVDYHADQDNGTLQYDCGRCHTTGWIEDPDPTTPEGKKDGLEGIWGDFYAGGIHCEQCHGTDHPGMIDDSAEACGACHIRGDANTIPASGGFVRHHEQYNEFLASPHSNFDCTSCHNPHKRAEFGIVTECEDCHGGIASSYANNTMYDYGVTCEDCHMPLATKSGQVTGPHQGDVMTHIFYIDTDPEANMFTEDGGFVALDSNGKAAVTMDFACQRCHVTASLDELALYADGFHSNDDSLEDIGLDPGLTGTWWDANRSGEGYLVQVGFFDGVLVFFGTFYTYNMEQQVWLTLETASIEGNKVNVNIYMPAGAQWGDAFAPGDVDRVLWGTGMVEFPTCTSANVMLTPNAEMQALGFTDQAYPITRTLDSGSRCPTFVNNEAAAAMSAASR